MKKLGLIIILFAAITPELLADGELWTCYESGNNLYIILRKPDYTVYDANIGGNTWEAWNDSNVAEYAIDLVDRGGDYYDTNVPTDINVASEIRVFSYLKAGANPATTDLAIGTATMAWSGSYELSFNLIATYITEMWLTDSGGFRP